MSISKLKIICIGLLALLFFAPAAGAIYIPGQTIPDDGQYHILAADGNVASSGMAPSSLSMPGNFAAMPMLSSGVAGTPLIGQADIAIPIANQAFPGHDLSTNGAENSMPPVPPGSSAIISPPVPPGFNMGDTTYPITTIPSAGSDGNIYMGSVIGHVVTPPVPGYWDNVDPASLHTNMPMLNSPIVFA